MNSQNRLVWIDLEMTGLSLKDNVIIEIATVITNAYLEEIAIGPILAIRQPKEQLAKMDQWNLDHHGKSGLIERVNNSVVTCKQAEQMTLNFLSKYMVAEHSPMCGNSICTDRRFLAKYMPKLEAFFHYRNLDVTSFKIISELWAPNISKQLVKTNKHEALSDIRDSIAELQFYRRHLIAKSILDK